MKHKTTIIQLWLSIILLATILTVSVVFYIDNLNNNFEQEVLRTMEEVSTQGAKAAQSEILAKEHMISDLATVISIDSEQDSDAIVASIQEQMLPIVRANGFRGMGIVLPDGTAYSTNGTVYDTGNSGVFRTALSGETTVSGRVALDGRGKDGKYVTVYSSPVYDKETGELVAAIYATYDINRFRSTMEVQSFHGDGYSYLVEGNGDVVVDSTNETAFKNMTNIYTSMREANVRNETAIQELKQYMEDEDSGRVVFTNDVDKYLYCNPVGINGWYLLTVVPVSVVDNQMNVVVRDTIILVVVLACIFLALILLLINQQNRKQKELLTLAYVDPVTGGDTFAKFQRDYMKAMEDLPNQKFALLSLDLNRFKMLNDLYGNEEGDRILQNMDAIWKEMLGEHEYCGHRMADRFAVLLTYTDREELKERVKEYRRRLQATARNRYNLSLRIGIYRIKDNKENFSTAQSRSMMAFSAAKDSEQHFYAFYDDAMEEQMIWEKNVEDNFQRALRNHEFVVFYQAKISVDSGKISGAEALVRWVKPDGTIIPPGQFIPVLESNDTIAELDRYMFREVCQQQKAWLDEGKPIVPVSVNLSRVQLADEHLVNNYKEILEETELPARYVELEFTESSMFDNETVLRDTVDQLHDMGMKVLIDDFGVGYSSMMSLKVIPVDILKLDKSFIDSIGDDRGNKIVVSIIEFATSLGMSVTAEGVENDEQYRFLQNHRCDDIQGYYFSRPIPAGEYARKYFQQSAE
ncbi:MAG: EAL domain-containing protein [Clostridium sp.]|nr:EAL domain-containing protein [Clostridium sp.]